MSKIINWQQIETILLDMDGTLLDMSFDIYFWQDYLVKQYAKKHNINTQKAGYKIYQAFITKSSNCQSIQYWSEILDIDIAGLIEQVADLIIIHPFVEQFLQEAQMQKKNIILISDAPKEAVELKMRLSKLARYFDKIISACDYNSQKYEQKFWHSLENNITFNKNKTVFFDDRLDVLKIAKEYGVKTIGISQPSIKLPLVDFSGFDAIKNFSKVLPVS